MIAKKQILEKNIQLLGFRLASRICSIYASADQRLYVPSITLIRQDTPVLFHSYISVSFIQWSDSLPTYSLLTPNPDSERLCQKSSRDNPLS